MFPGGFIGGTNFSSVRPFVNDRVCWCCSLFSETDDNNLCIGDDGTVGMPPFKDGRERGGGGGGLGDLSSLTPSSCQPPSSGR